MLLYLDLYLCLSKRNDTGSLDAGLAPVPLSGMHLPLGTAARFLVKRRAEDGCVGLVRLSTFDG